MRLYGAILIVVTVPLLMSCDRIDILSVHVGNGGLELRVYWNTLVVRNTSSETVHYVVVEERDAALIDFYSDPRKWPQVGPGDRLAIEYPQIMGYDTGDERVLVYWWTASGGYGSRTLDLS